jgi:hypothetical protein
MPQNCVFTTSTVGTEDVVGEALAGVGIRETVGLVDGLGPVTVGAFVGAGLRHLSAMMP